MQIFYFEDTNAIEAKFEAKLDPHCALYDFDISHYYFTILLMMRVLIIPRFWYTVVSFHSFILQVTLEIVLF